MKVVLFCGGQGTRLREYSETIPKPMVNIGYRPIIWHVMKYYAHYGHTEFVLALGYRGEMIKRYFLDYLPMSRDFTLQLGRTGDVVYHTPAAADDWRVTLVDMRERGAQVSDEELERLVEWLARVWGTNQDK